MGYLASAISLAGGQGPCGCGEPTVIADATSAQSSIASVQHKKIYCKATAGRCQTAAQ